jgi:RluA family pseudouridine synthase
METEPSIDFLAIETEFVVVNKPGGLLTQAPPGIDSLETRLKRWKYARDDSRPPYVGVPHRLDRPVSGILVIGQTRKWTGKLAEQFERRSVEKTYWAVVADDTLAPDGRWHDWMRKVEGESRSEVCDPEDSGAQEAVLRCRRMAASDGMSWLEIQLETGRTHQIRLQCAARQVSILGDSIYGSRQTFGPADLDPRKHWIALHARSLAFDHPRTGQRLAFTAPLPPPWFPLKTSFPAMFQEPGDLNAP